MANFFQYEDSEGKTAAVNIDLIRHVTYNPDMKFIAVHFDANHTVDFSGPGAEGLFQALEGHQAGERSPAKGAA